DTKPFTMTAPMMIDSQGLPLTEPKTPQMVFTMQLPHPVPPMSFIRHAWTWAEDNVEAGIRLAGFPLLI
ncbi:MAG: U32 family peptidase C-terminal domain-containing protein, partial [Oscillospiraceae bacterium]